MKMGKNSLASPFALHVPRDVILGERCVLWVRNAHIDGRFFFERFYQDKYIGRSAVLADESSSMFCAPRRVSPGRG